MIKIIIADDHQAIIDGCQAYIIYSDEMEIIATANDGEELIDLCEKYQPDVVLTDIRMPKIDGIEAIKIIRKQYPSIKFVAFSMFEKQEVVKMAMRVGADAYVLKNSGLKILCSAIYSVNQGETYFDPNLSKFFLEKDDSETIREQKRHLLSKREKEILTLIAKGKTSKEIAEELFLSKTTVDTHRKNMCRKLELSGNALIQFAIELDLYST